MQAEHSAYSDLPGLSHAVNGIHQIGLMRIFHRLLIEPCDPLVLFEG